jgi:hypothetical protein
MYQSLPLPYRQICIFILRGKRIGPESCNTRKKCGSRRLLAGPEGFIQDRRTPHPACPVLHPAAGRKLLDTAAVSADRLAHRAARVAPDMIESAGSCGEQPCPRGGVSLARGGGGGKLVELAQSTALVPQERSRPPNTNGQIRSSGRHVICSATRENEELGPNRKSRLTRKT